MLSPADMLLIGGAALIFFGPDQLPKVAKRAGQVVRDVQNTSQSFIREMERAADDTERREREAASAREAPVSPPVTEDAESVSGSRPEARAAFVKGENHVTPSDAPGAAPPAPGAPHGESYEI